jgi:hypothetical protein
MKVNLPPRQRLLVIVAGAGILLLILESIVYDPLAKTWQTHAAEIAQLKKSVSEGRTMIARGPQLERVWSEMQTSALPKDPAQAEQDVLSAFDRWGRVNSVEIGSIRPQWKRGATDRYSLLECRVDASGTISSLSKFLYDLERSTLALRVDSVEVMSRDDGGQRLTLGVVVSGLRFAPLERKL